MADDISFDFEADIQSSHLLTQGQQQGPLDLPAEAIGQQPGNYRKNFRKTVCTYWLRGLCMKGDTCGFLHQFASERMPVCRNLLKYGECKEQDCPYKHTLDEIKECNMYKLGFCIYGQQCRFRHVKVQGPPPNPEEVEACKPKQWRNVNVVVNQANPGTLEQEEERPFKRGGGRGFGRGGGRGEPLALPGPGDWRDGGPRGRGGHAAPRGRPAPPPGDPPAARSGAPPDMPPLMGPPPTHNQRPPQHPQQHPQHSQQHPQHPQHRPQHPQHQQQQNQMPPMAGLLQPMPDLMPPPGGPPPPGGLPPGAMQPPFNAMFAAMAGQAYGGFPRPY